MTPPEAVLVTGGFGAIGSFVSRQLAREGHTVIVYSRARNFSLVPELEGRIQWAPGDVTDRDALDRAAREHHATRVIHLAAALPAITEDDPIRAYQVNLMGGLNVLTVARDLRLKRVVFTSSKAYYGRFVGEHAPPHFKPVTEDYQGQTATVYGATKKALEDAAFHFRRQWEVDVIALRLGSTYGPGKGTSSHGGYSGLKSRIIEASLRGEPVTVEMPDAADDIVYNADVAKGAVLACFAPRPEYWQLNISGGQLVTLRAFANEAARLIPQHQLTIPAPRGGDVGIPTNITGLLSIERARTAIGYEPDYPGIAGVEAYVRDCMGAPAQPSGRQGVGAA